MNDATKSMTWVHVAAICTTVALSALTLLAYAANEHGAQTEELYELTTQDARLESEIKEQRRDFADAMRQVQLNQQQEILDIRTLEQRLTLHGMSTSDGMKLQPLEAGHREP